MIMTEEQQRVFIERLIDKKAKPSITSIYHTTNGGDNMRVPALMDLLMIDQSLLTEDGKEAISYLESVGERTSPFLSFENFKWKVMAFLAIQDLIRTPVFSDTTTESFLQVKYFYYESKYILTEVIIASLNGLH